MRAEPQPSHQDEPAHSSAVKCKVFTQQAAMIFELGQDRNGQPCNNVEGAHKAGEVYAWGDKVLFQISTDEALEVMAVLMGLREKVMLVHPNKKQLGVKFNDDGSLYIRLEKAGAAGSLFNLQALSSKAIGIANVCMAAIQKEYSNLDSILLRDLIRGIAARSARAHKRQ